MKIGSLYSRLIHPPNWLFLSSDFVEFRQKGDRKIRQTFSTDCFMPEK